MQRKFKFILLMGLLYGPTAANAAEALSDTAATYREKYRPQYHFTPAHRWIGDPCGCLRHGGRYLAYSWGAAESPDLVHWHELNKMAVKGVPEGTATFTGSVAVDAAGDAGYGPGALIAAFTSFDEHTKKQSQSIAFSIDSGLTYRYYDLNPVLDIWSTEFRDPTVLRDDSRGRWVMAVAKALEKKVAFYASTDFKHWSWLSDFGPMGDSERSWECPDLFRLPVEGTGEMKWVLVVSVNWAREQYFVGDFDGTRFIPDCPDAAPLYVDEGLDYYASRTFRDYDHPASPQVHSIAWVNTWDYAVPAPSQWGKGIWSLPRQLSLRPTPEGLRLRQRPAQALDGLRGQPVHARARGKGLTPLPQVEAMGNQYLLQADIAAGGVPDLCGLVLSQGPDGRCVRILYDTASHCLTADRTNSTDAELPKFDRTCHTRIHPAADGKLHLDIYVDHSVIEIFANDGEATMSLLTFAAPDQTGVSAFSLAGTAMELTAWPMASIWHD